MTLILDEAQIQQKIKRLAIQIVENNFEESEIILAGINNNGLGFAKLIADAIDKIEFKKPIITQTQIRLNPAAPLSAEVEIDFPIASLKDKVVIIVDDVANTGRTLFYAMKPIINQVIPRKVEAAVLVDRQHKSFPIKVDYFGLTLATTLSENIEVLINDVAQPAVYLR